MRSDLSLNTYTSTTPGHRRGQKGSFDAHGITPPPGWRSEGSKRQNVSGVLVVHPTRKKDGRYVLIVIY